MNENRIARILAMGGLGFLAGCANDGLPGDETIAAAVTRQCEVVEACPCAGWLFADQSCERTWTERWQQRAAEGDEHNLQYDASCMQTQLDLLEQLRCDPARPEWRAPLCTSYCGVWHGTRALGESCEGFDAVVSTCAQGLVCDAGVCVEPCSVLSGLREGEPCMNLGNRFDDCAMGLYCSYSTGLCEAVAQHGESCWDDLCADGLYCRSSADPTCVSVVSSCFDSGCDDGFECLGSGETWICRESRDADLGATCANSRRCVTGAFCNYGNDRCEATSTEGQSCVSGECADGLWCDRVQDACIPLLADADECTGHSQCASGYCPQGYCERPPGPDEACGVQLACDFGLACVDNVCQPATARGSAACLYRGW